MSSSLRSQQALVEVASRGAGARSRRSSPLRSLLAVSVESLALPLALGSVFGSNPRLRALLSRVRSRVFDARGHVLRLQLGGVSGNTGRFGSLGEPILGSWRS